MSICTISAICLQKLCSCQHRLHAQQETAASCSRMTKALCRFCGSFTLMFPSFRHAHFPGDIHHSVVRANDSLDDDPAQVVYKQPQSVPQARAEPIYHLHPSTSHSMSQQVSQWVNTGRDLATRASSRASFSTLTRPRRSHSVHKTRPSISLPTNFQHFDDGLELDSIQSMVNHAPMPVRGNRSTRRLELSIYLPNGRLSPLPDFADDEAWGTIPMVLERPEQALIRVKDSRTNSLSSNPSSCGYFADERRLSGTTMATMQTQTLSIWPESSDETGPLIEKPATIRRSRTADTLSPARVLSRLPSPSRNRANTAPSSRPSSLRRTKTDVDEAIRELNTIVEERRASEYRSQAQSPALINRPPPSPSHHVPYLAPSMRMHVRCETLSDIGSAFSAPIRFDKDLPIVPTARRLTLAPPSRNSTMALCSNPITPPAPHTPTSMSRLTTWFKRSMSTSTTPTSPMAPKPYDTEPFYQYGQVGTSRPSTSGSRTVCHTRQESEESNTVTLFSSSPTASSMSSRTESPANSPPRRTKRVPVPLVLVKRQDLQIEVAARGGKELKPPMSPHAHSLCGMEISAKYVGKGTRSSMMMPSPSAVGVAF
jgi:hypothetical protein